MRLRIALAIGIVIALLPPLSYGLVSYRYLANEITFVADLQSARVSKYIYAHEDLWQYQLVRITEIVELHVDQSSKTEQRIFNNDGKLLLTVGESPGLLQLTRDAPLVVADRQIGRLEVSIPLSALALELFFFSLLSSLIGIAAYYARALPLRRLDQAVGELEAAKNILEQRSGQLNEAQHLGLIGDWSYNFGEDTLWWADEIFNLLGYDPDTFDLTRDRVMELYGDDDASRLLELQSEVVKHGVVRSIDVRVRRGDGEYGHFAVTTKLRSDKHGDKIGVYGTIQDITDRKLASEQLEKLAFHDPLTGLANRTLFHRRVDDALGRCARTGEIGALLLLDLDRFKDVNDTLGHAVGDALLVKVAHLLARTLGNAHFVSRLGGDEFAVLLEGVSDRDESERIATEIVAVISGMTVLDRIEVTVGTSIGIAMLLDHGRTSDELLRSADLALYRAKEEGRGRYRIFESSMDEAVQEKVALSPDLRNALADDQGLSVHYQPQIEILTGRVIGYEALIRWNHPVRGNIPPALFIPIAESSHLICDVGYWVLRQAAFQAKEWLDAGVPTPTIAVNVSAAQIWNSDLVSDVGKVLAESDLPPHLLCLELTESLLMDQNESRVRNVLKSLKEFGVTLALDDFGTGYSSLGYLTQLPFDKLKIDRIFIDGVNTSQRSTELLRGIIALGRGLGMTTIAEGAETQEEVAVLRELGCDQIQGFFFARPAPADEALAYALRMAADALVAATPDRYQAATA
ncbi:putative bifunctional diguanylate cyclase/phosphodiesterase [Hoeflea ulvae]|uniref:EAL domain-containing protein n=1 Tax=Hoeflea ulvae TaxID=2983764 RepID=A0ABT3YLE1_9HYPH|nr:GGDEF domain-containing phosphodiesterase [Hoeflea ulvae]MCY0096728.1 EAL domain-containing protein [Hoeflea ulvae]